MPYHITDHALSLCLGFVKVTPEQPNFFAAPLSNTALGQSPSEQKPVGFGLDDNGLPPTEAGRIIKTKKGVTCIRLPPSFLVLLPSE